MSTARLRHLGGARYQLIEGELVMDCPSPVGTYRYSPDVILDLSAKGSGPAVAGLLNQFADAIEEERLSAHRKHGAHSMESAEVLSHRRASILMEEAAECGRALNDHDLGKIVLGGPNGTGTTRPPRFDALDTELIQTAAMAFTWWANRRGDRLPDPGPEPEPEPEVMDDAEAVELLRSINQRTFLPMPLRREVEAWLRARGETR